MTLTKDAIISAVAEAAGYPRAQAVEPVETLIEIIQSKLAAAKNLPVRPFGKFFVKEKGEKSPSRTTCLILAPTCLNLVRESRQQCA